MIDMQSNDNDIKKVNSTGYDKLKNPEAWKQRQEGNKKILTDISNKLISSGYKIASNLTGKRIKQPEANWAGEYNCLGILCPKKWAFLGVRLPVTTYAWPGTLWIDNDALHAQPDKNWVIDVYGRENLQNIETLVRKLSKPYDVNITSRIATTGTRVEGQKQYYPGFFKDD